MKKAISRCALLALIGCFPPAPGWGRELWRDADGGQSLIFKSSFKGDWEQPLSIPGSPASQGEAVAFGRLRLEPEGNINDELKAGLTWDLKGWLTPAMVTSNLLPNAAPGFFRLTAGGSQHTQDHLSWQQELDRAWVAYQPESGNFTLGRQAIGWGRGALFSAVDIFVPFSPWEVDQQWRRGVDALRGDFKLTNKISLDLVAAPGTNPLIPDSPVTLNDSALAARLRGDLGTWDAELVAGRRGQDRLAGFTASLPLGDLEMHGEAAVFLAPGDVPDAGLGGNPNLVPKILCGVSNHFPLGQGLTVAVEYHYSGFGVSDIRTLPERRNEPAYLLRYARGDSQIPGKQAWAFQGIYALNEWWQTGLNVLQSATDNSGFLAPSLDWNFTENITLLATGLWAYGRPAEGGIPQSQFGNSTPTWLVQVRIYD
ncbi:MAG: hypothetical protein HGA76_03185 [Candidatus Firestonebacteria bacterium]|nr:hypothetical protein [Candidatus Firestonebacteria bacterium]